MSSGNQCLHNSLIVQNILKNINVAQDIQLRLINRTCDEEVLRRMRRTFRRVRIEIEQEKLPKIRVNGCLVKPRECFQFLIDRVGIKVVKLEVVRDGKLKSWKAARKVHNLILDVLIKDQTLTSFKGMRAICGRECHRCGKYAMKVKEFGPLSLWGARNFFDSSKHFDKLIVDDQFLWSVERACQLSHGNWADQMVLMKSYVHSRISCDHLQIQLYDDPTPNENDLMDRGLPREILEEMCKSWRVKSLRISFQSQNRGKRWVHLNGGWDVFTEIRWNSWHQRTPMSTGFLLDSVEVDVEKAPRLFNSVFGDDDVSNNLFLIPNIRRVFPAKKFSLNGHRMSIDSCPRMLTNHRFDLIMRAAMFGTSRSNNSPLTIRHYCQVNNRYFNGVSEFNWNFEGDINGQFTVSIVPGETIRDVYDGVERVGKTFQIREKWTGCVINLEIYVEKDKLEEMIMRHRIPRMGIFRHYVYATRSFDEVLPRNFPFVEYSRVLRQLKIQNMMSSDPSESLDHSEIQNPISLGLVRSKDSLARFTSKLASIGIRGALSVYKKSTTRAYITTIYELASLIHGMTGIKINND